VCQEFSCVPSVAERELDINGPTVLDVLWTRNYARAKAAYDGRAQMSPEALARLMSDRMVQLVRDTDFALIQEALDARKTDG
jgi:hypothetical protein